MYDGNKCYVNELEPTESVVQLSPLKEVIQVLSHRLTDVDRPQQIDIGYQPRTHHMVENPASLMVLCCPHIKLLFKTFVVASNNFYPTGGSNLHLPN